MRHNTTSVQDTYSQNYVYLVGMSIEMHDKHQI